MRLYFTSLLAFGLVPACLAAPETAPAPQWSPDQQAIIALIEHGPMGIETDFEAWESKYHEDWTVWFPGQETVRAKGPHMTLVRDYIGSGAKVISYEAQFADIAVFGDTALARFNAVERLENPDGSPRVVYYGGTDLLIRVDDTWKVRTTTVSLMDPPEME